ncbi:uncharacterized protein OCT59_019473 [Rhizophagus irregularis]|uniref:F-box domain-containing protein n=2 Tax=Rhizophagus irregularis TaxID=588596 RepID=A0A015LC34_RHIIW|nr:hypothetical protein GLOIN_2v1801806 [Rhizophagus irregularis DAOM 181602=DAOM 197198]EXX52398.1 hypothetical protein RirG_253280 [Rhizophagus irregularis DAOM 197198w]UZO27270.1 hypothetical protein OCT59_019473 [Rhizophagus irregularis]POG66760.1 hypothetical protein GLOIN_2v1801806 [Rhizophagus irregularis DAOM 181602=DAOM 197198]CAG8447986.1 10906_t:CDS:1 [Rhizophagus irregularis]GBC51470.1 hypothetical protein GLOIN_2v1801806 [Rhizophagus irregularis DAOM 181602=DAOM 197198]|eukprot:XP_025173626.1 hypothetical protein GLOIN_2v1801806 [Rhizophagus irregularis DAOM 181602=DAOM 197198]
MAMTLPTECWQEILKNVPIEDKKTLKSCLMVNRSMCKIIIPILWSNPFRYLQSSPHDQPMPSRINEQEEIIKMKINQKKLINVYISCMDYKSIDILNNNKIEIINMDKSIMFDYPSMLRELQYNIICESSSSWLYQELQLIKEFKVTTEDLEHNSKTREFKKLLLTRELCKMFMKSSTLIMNLTLSYYVPFVDMSFTPKDFFLINKLPGAEKSLKNLKKFKCSLLIDQWKEITKDLTKICGTNGSLEILELKCIGEPSVEWIDDKSFINICELIKRQKSLKHIKLNCCGKYCNISKAISSLSSQIDNIKSLEFVHLKFNSNNDNFPLNFISKCKKLNTLIFKDCDELLDYNIFTIKDTPWFNHLTKLVFEDTSISPFNITKIISFCNKLKELSCDLGEEIEFLPEFALSLPISLKHLTIDAVEININILQQFLENIKATLETLNFPAWICRSFTDQHLYIICDKLKNSLKRLDLDLMSPENQQHNVSFESIEYARKEIEVVNIESYFRYDSW